MFEVWTTKKQVEICSKSSERDGPLQKVMGAGGGEWGQSNLKE